MQSSIFFTQNVLEMTKGGYIWITAILKNVFLQMRANFSTVSVSYITLLALVGYFSLTVVVPTHGGMCSEEISGQISWFLVWSYSVKDTVVIVLLSNLNPYTDSQRNFWCIDSFSVRRKYNRIAFFSFLEVRWSVLKLRFLYYTYVVILMVKNEGESPFIKLSGESSILWQNDFLSQERIRNQYNFIILLLFYRCYFKFW